MGLIHPRSTHQSILLIGGGHAHIQFLKAWHRSPVPNIDLYLISDSEIAIYSGMVPGYIAGQYDFQTLSFNLESICDKVGVIFIKDKAVALDPKDQILTLQSGEKITYDILSINMGSTVAPLSHIPPDIIIPTRPILGLIQDLDKIFQKEKVEIEKECANISVVGGGAAGYEIAVCLAERIKKELPGEIQKTTIHLIAGKRGLLSGMSRGVIKKAEKVLFKKGILVLNERVTGLDNHILRLQSGLSLPVSKIIWATGAAPHPEWKNFNLSLSEKGFIPVMKTLQNPEFPNIFIVGDSAEWLRKSIPKAGVYAVKMGGILIKNIRKMIKKGVSTSLATYVPQSGFLRLLNNGDGTAIGNFHGLNFKGKYMYSWKDKIDRRFMETFQIDL